MTQYHFVGVDVAKNKFDAAVSVNNNYYKDCFNNDKKGYQTFLKWLKKLPQGTPWICMEATGHYSELIADFLIKQNIRVSIVNPLQIKNFARAKLSRNKTDALDAKLIAEYCQLMRPREFVPRTPSQKTLKDLTKLLDTLKAQHVQLSNQLHSAQSEMAKKIIRKLIKELEKEIARIEKQIADVIKSNQHLEEKMELITSIKGIGKLTAYKVLSHIPDMNCFANAKQFAAFIGISPRQHQSGKFQGKTTISRLGDSRLRKVFYMAALVAKRFNNRLQPFVERLQNKGKAPKAIICAVMRKLAHLVFGVLKSRRPFDVNFA
jgi:transposase